MDMTESRVSTYLSNNPRMIGVCFTMLVLLAQAGSAAAAGNCSVLTGP